MNQSIRAPRRSLLAAALLLGAAQAAGADTSTVRQGDIARWSGLPASECGFLGKRYPAVDATCYYPVDMSAKTGRHEVALYDQNGERHLGAIDVVERECEKMHVELEDDRYIDPSPEDLARHQGERERVLAAVATRSGAPRFSLPLAAPAGEMPRGDDDFCALRTFNEREEPSRHTGRDYAIGKGNAVASPADGTVLIAEELFMTGNSVFIDHGGGLVSEFFHLDAMDVEPGDEVERGQRVATTGSTGRSTGPHLHVGFRWADQRIDPADLLDSPNALADVADGSDDPAFTDAGDEDPAKDDAEVDGE